MSASFYAALTGEAIRRPPIIHHSARGEFALREGRWKLTVNEGRGKKRAARTKHELYDLNSDPSETDNLATAHPDRVRAMSDTLDRLRAAAGSVR